MPDTVGSHSVAAFTSPSNGDALDANVVKGNDNSLRTAYVAHDADPGIHVQSSLLASRPAAGTVGRKWMTTDSGSVRLWYDTGSVWEEITTNLTALNASNLTSGTVPDARFPATLPAASAANLTNIPAANVTGTFGNVTMSGSGTANLQDGVLQRPRIQDYGEVRTTPSISAGTLTLNLESGNVFGVSLNANITTLTIQNPSASGTACSFTLAFTADGTLRTVTWGASVKWAGGVAPTLTSTNGKVDIFVFTTWDAGTTWYGFTAGQNF